MRPNRAGGFPTWGPREAGRRPATPLDLGTSAARGRVPRGAALCSEARRCLRTGGERGACRRIRPRIHPGPELANPTSGLELGRSYATCVWINSTHDDSMTSAPAELRRPTRRPAPRDERSDRRAAAHTVVVLLASLLAGVLVSAGLTGCSNGTKSYCSSLKDEQKQLTRLATASAKPGEPGADALDDTVGVLHHGWVGTVSG